MKKIVLFISTFTVLSTSYAADTLSTSISKATVFLSGAQVFRESKPVTIKKGVNEVVIKDVSPYINQQLIQATAKGDFLILDVQFQTEYIAPIGPEPTIQPKEVQMEINWLNDSLLFIGFEKERIQSKLDNLQEEKRMITQNQLIKSGGISDTLPEFKAIVEFYRVKLDEINELIHIWKKKQYYAQVREAKYRSRLNELNQYSYNVGQPTRPASTRYHIVVTTYAEIATTGKIEVNYMVANAGWIPAYDLRADNTTDPMSVTYKARVFQNSGEDWDDVRLTLSTYNQNLMAVKPILGVWRLDYVMNKTGNARDAVYYSQNFESQAQMDDFEKTQLGQAQNQKEVLNKQYLKIQDLAEINQNFTNVEFAVKLPYSIKADGSQKLMVVTQNNVQASFTHYLVPRLNKNAFLLAKISDWEDLSLLPGPANIYFNHTFVGNTTIDPLIMSDTMELTLGHDMGITATRKKVNEEYKKVALGKRELRTYTFEIEVKNTSRAEADLLLEDLIPITKNEDILIKLVEANGADHNDTTGRLNWAIKIKPGEKKTIRFTYSVEHNKDQPVS